MKPQKWSQKAEIKAFEAKSHLWQCSHTRFDSESSFADIGLTLEASERGIVVSKLVVASLIDGQTRVDFRLQHLE